MNTIQPGKCIDSVTAAGLEAQYGSYAAEQIKTAEEAENMPIHVQVIEMLIPANPITAVASETPNLLHLMFFALVVGMAATVVAPKVVAPFIGFLEGLYEISTKIIEGIMKFAPYEKLEQIIFQGFVTAETILREY